MSTTLKEARLQIGGEEFVIKPLVMRKRDLLIEMIASSFTQMNEKFPDIMKAPQTDVVVHFLKTAGSRLVDLYELILGKDKEWLLDNVTLENEVEIISAIYEVNNIPLLLSQIAKFRGKKI